MRSRCILITNLQVKSRSGTELYVRDLAFSLQSLGHRPFVFTSDKGPLAESLVRRSIPVLDNLGDTAVTPDIIHGHHNLETMSAMLRFPSTPGIFICHDSFSWHDKAPKFPRIYRYVAVDNACYDRLSMTDGVPKSKIAFIQNGVDLKRFQPRSSLPKQPRRALLLSNYATPAQYRTIERACRKMGVHLDAAGKPFANLLEFPEKTLAKYDIVFAKGRCAWEALAVGSAVIVCDAMGCGSMVTVSKMQSMAEANFGRRLLTAPIRSSVIQKEIEQYDSHDAAQVSKAIREQANLSRTLHQLVDLYESVIAEHSDTDRDIHSEFQASSDYLQWWAINRNRLFKEGRKRYRPDQVASRLIQSVWKRTERQLMVKRAG